MAEASAFASQRTCEDRGVCKTHGSTTASRPAAKERSLYRGNGLGQPRSIAPVQRATRYGFVSSYGVVCIPLVLAGTFARDGAFCFARGGPKYTIPVRVRIGGP